jgi:S1-C subfamily serine protease
MKIRWALPSISLGLLLISLMGMTGQASADGKNNLTSIMIIASEISDAKITISDDDPVPTGAKFRLEVSSDTNLVIDISIKTSSGSNQILQGSQLKAGTTGVLPGQGKWLLVPEQEGPQRVLVKARAKSGEITTVTHSFLAGSIKLEKDARISELSNLAPLVATTLNSKKKVIGQISGISSNSLKNALSYASDLIESAEPDLPLSFRGSGVQVFSKASSSVVKVLTNEGSGTGSILSSKGDILTNWHVVEGYKSVGIRFKPKNTIGVSDKHIFVADVTRVDEVADLALIKLRDNVGKLPVINLSKTDEPEVGSNVHAIGHPQGQDWTYTRGYISQIREDFS